MHKYNKILLIMPSFWDPICPPQGIVSLKSYIESLGYEVFIRDFNTDPKLFGLQRKYFELGVKFFPHWKFLNIFRNGPRYFARHQLAWFFGRGKGAKYEKLISSILNMDGKSVCTKEMIKEFDAIIAEVFKIVESKTDELIKQLDPDIIGCTMLESTFPSALAVLKTAKNIKSQIATLLGGPGPLMGDQIEHGNLQRIINNCPWIDTIICGEGEILFENYLKGVFGDEKIIGIQDLKDTKDMADATGLLADLDNLPKPNFEGLTIERYLWLSVFTSRGCPFRCAFCFENSFWKRFRIKNLKKVSEEFKDLSALYKNNKFYLCDSLANPIINDLSACFRNNGAKYEYDTYVRVTEDCLSNEKVKQWADGGLTRARIGVESTSPRVLKLMNKRITAEWIKQSLENFAANGIFTSTLWIAGFPGETEENFLESIGFLKDNHKNIYQADIWEFICSPEGFSIPDENINHRAKPAYSEEFDDILPLRYYELENSISPAERFERINLFEKTRMDLGIPNPYSIIDLMKAKERWIELGHLR